MYVRVRVRVRVCVCVREGVGEGEGCRVCGGWMGERRGHRLEWISNRKGCGWGEEKLERGEECGRSGAVIVREGEGKTGGMFTTLEEGRCRGCRVSGGAVAREQS